MIIFIHKGFMIFHMAATLFATIYAIIEQDWSLVIIGGSVIYFMSSTLHSEQS